MLFAIYKSEIENFLQKNLLIERQKKLLVELILPKYYFWILDKSNCLSTSKKNDCLLLSITTTLLTLIAKHHFKKFLGRTESDSTKDSPVTLQTYNHSITTTVYVVIVISNKRANPIFTPKWQEEKSIGKENYAKKKKEFMTVHQKTSPPTKLWHYTIQLNSLFSFHPLFLCFSILSVCCCLPFCEGR